MEDLDGVISAALAALVRGRAVLAQEDLADGAKRDGLVALFALLALLPPA